MLVAGGLMSCNSWGRSRYFKLEKSAFHIGDKTLDTDVGTNRHAQRVFISKISSDLL
jgi:hypothetical protein